MSRADELRFHSARAIKNACVAKSLNDASNQKKVIHRSIDVAARHELLAGQVKPGDAK